MTVNKKVLYVDKRMKRLLKKDKINNRKRRKTFNVSEC